VREVRLERVYRHPPEKVWRTLTDPAVVATWLMKSTGFEARVGCTFQFRVDKPPVGWRGIVDCEVLEVDPPRRLAYSWRGEPRHRPTVVTWTIEPVPEGSRVLLVHSGFRGLGGALLSRMLGSGWKKMMDTSFPAALEGRAADPSARC
jgi:uncharacterized protein YndB with AHSA1/START domain